MAFLGNCEEAEEPAVLVTCGICKASTSHYDDQLNDEASFTAEAENVDRSTRTAEAENVERSTRTAEAENVERSTRTAENDKRKHSPCCPWG